MRHAFPSPALPITLTALLLSGCGSSADDVKTFPGVGMANPNGKGLIHAQGGQSPAQSPSNAQRADIHSLKEFIQLMHDKDVGMLSQYPAVLGPFKVAQRGPYAGSVIYPNLYFDGWFVKSILLIPSPKDDVRIYIKNGITPLDLGVEIKEIPFIRPEQDDWFTVRPETDTTP